MKKTARQPVKPGFEEYANLFYIRARLAWVTLMERGSSRLGIRGQRIAWVLLGIFGISACLFLIFGIPGKLTKGIGLRPERISKMKTAVDYKEGPVMNGASIKSQLQGIRQYLDSLSASQSGRVILDSITAARPGLLDSLTMAEQIINNHKN